MERARSNIRLILVSTMTLLLGLTLGVMSDWRPWVPSGPPAVPLRGATGDGAQALNNPPVTATKAGDTAAGQHRDEHRMPIAACPVDPARDRDPDPLLDTAATRYDAGAYAEAYACASMAADLVPGSIDAHHIRAVAAAALGRFDTARSAYALALALDPDDPETLAAAADFYINVLGPKHRDTTMLGLEYAHRGRSRVVARRRRQRPLRARLSLLEAQAFNDLGVAEQAIERLDETLSLVPELVEARYERGVSLYNLCRFEESQAAFEGVLRETPDDAYAHHHLGLVYERLGRAAAAESHLARARELAPAEFREPVLLSPEAFRAEVDRAVAELPPEISALLADVAVEVSDVPAIEDLTAVEPPFSPTILGLYRGLPLGVDEAAAGGDPVPPRAVVLYRKNLARAVRAREELDAQIRRTLLHEIGHLQGLDEADLRLRGLD